VRDAFKFELQPERPYDLARTLARYTRFPEVVDRVDAGVYRRLLLAGGEPTLIRVAQQGTPAQARLAIELRGRDAHGAETRALAERVVRRALGAGLPVRDFYRRFRTDPVLARAIARERGLRGAGSPSAFEALVTAVLSQQVNLRFAYSIRSELAERFGVRARFEDEEFVAFPTAERLARLSATELRALRLSAAKATALHGIAEAFASGALAEAELEALPDEAAIAALCALRGVGRWTAEIALLRGLGRADVFPAADLGVVKYLAQGLLGRREKAGEAEMRAFAERWRPHRSLALLYAYAELAHRKRSAQRGAAERSPDSAQRSPTRARKKTSPP
jgi:DNA-3-methyladenine glycosylase II